VIERIRIRNYRSLRDVEVKLEPLTVLIGRSGSGKSNFVRSIRMLRDIIAGKVQLDAWADQTFWGGDGALAYEIDLSVSGIGLLRYEVDFSKADTSRSTRVKKPTIESDETKTTSYDVTPRPIRHEKLSVGNRVLYHHANGKWVTPPVVDPKPVAGPLALGTLTGLREATVTYVALTRGIGCYDFPGTVLQQKAPLEKAPDYKGDGDNHLVVASRILDAIERLDDWISLAKSMTALNPRLRTLDLTLPKRDYLRVGYAAASGRTFVADVSQESEGFRRYLGHLLALYQTPPKQTLIFEHPEHGIHPGALEALSEEFKSHVEDRRGQVILTTHSPQLLDYFEPEQLRVVMMDGEQTRIGPLAADQLEPLRQNLMTPGDLLTVDLARIETPTEVGA
jgi:predicted ATPase